MSRRISDWWPRCAKCDRPVQQLFVEREPAAQGKKRFIVVCHGMHVYCQGMSPELARKMDADGLRLPDAFTGKKPKPHTRPEWFTGAVTDDEKLREIFEQVFRRQ